MATFARDMYIGRRGPYGTEVLRCDTARKRDRDFKRDWLIAAEHRRSCAVPSNPAVLCPRRRRALRNALHEIVGNSRGFESNDVLLLCRRERIRCKDRPT